MWTLFGVAGIDLAFAQDDHGNTRETASVATWAPLNVIGLPEGAPKTESSRIAGNLEREVDIDYFRFIVERYSEVSIAAQGTNTPHQTSIRIILEDSHGRVLDDSLSNMSEGESDVGSAVSKYISAGAYYVRVSGRDRPDLRRRGAPIRNTGAYIIHAILWFPGNDDHSDISRTLIRLRAFG